jgi:hypothetical protein
MMDTAVAAAPSTPASAKPGGPKRQRRSRQQTEEVTRYFLAKEGSSPTKPELGEEVASEGEALIKAFQSKTGVVYFVHAYKADAEMQGGSPVLVKRPWQAKA